MVGKWVWGSSQFEFIIFCLQVFSYNYFLYSFIWFDFLKSSRVFVCLFILFFGVGRVSCIEFLFFFLMISLIFVEVCWWLYSFFGIWRKMRVRERQYLFRVIWLGIGGGSFGVRIFFFRVVIEYLIENLDVVLKVADSAGVFVFYQVGLVFQGE